MSDRAARRGGWATEPVAAADRPTGRRRSDRIIGVARATQEAVDQAMAAANASVPVYVTGPEGSGRQHIARAVHSWSNRASGPFVAVACVVGNELLVSRELFGSTASAQSLPAEEQAGALSQAAEGTLFLASAERLPDAVRQAMREALAEGRFKRHGSSTSSALRARVIASSSVAAKRSLFGDLPHQTIRLLPLAQRREDVLPLAAHFLRLYAEEQGLTPVGFTADAREALLEDPWPGNVRELAERIRQAIGLAGNGAVTAEALLLAGDGDDVPSFKEAKRAFETRYVIGLLRRCDGNISRAARLAQKDRKDFYDVIRRTGIDPADFR